MKFLRPIGLTAIASFILLGNWAHAQTTFNGTNLTGDFGTAANWSSGVPSGNTTGTIANGDDATVAGTYSLGGTSGVTIALGTSTTSGELDVNSGSLAITNFNGGSHGGNTVLIDGGSLSIGGPSVNVILQNATVNMSSGSFITPNGFSLNSGLTFNQSGGSFSVSNTSNTYLSGATWKISGGSVSPTGDWLHFQSGTLDVVGQGATSIGFDKLIMTTSGGTPVLQFDLTAAGVTPVNVTTALTLGGTLTINGANYTGGVGLIPLITGQSALGQSFTTVNINGITGTIQYLSTGVDLNVTAVPEPSTWALLLTGSLVSLRFILRRRRPGQI